MQIIQLKSVTLQKYQKYIPNTDLISDSTKIFLDPSKNSVIHTEKNTIIKR